MDRFMRMLYPWFDHHCEPLYRYGRRCPSDPGLAVVEGVCCAKCSRDIHTGRVVPVGRVLADVLVGARLGTIPGEIIPYRNTQCSLLHRLWA